MPTNTKRRRRLRKELVIIAIVCAGCLYGILEFAEWSRSKDSLQIYFVNPDGSESRKFAMEIAASPGERNKGLMFRKPGELEADEGMLFVFPSERVNSFWMKNTYISLDMIFVDRSLEVVGVIDNVPVLNERQQSVNKPSQYVVELLAGVSKQHGIVVGSKMNAIGQIPVGR